MPLHLKRDFILSVYNPTIKVESTVLTRLKLMGKQAKQKFMIKV